MKVLGIVGSPRHGGNTGTLVEQVLAGAESKGAQTELIYLNDLNIKPCQACEVCTASGKCVQDDDMQKVYAALSQANVLVLGSPIYLNYPTAQTMLFLNRLFAYIGPHHEILFPKALKRALVILTWANPKPDLYKGVADQLSGLLKGFFGIEVIQTLMAAGFGHDGRRHRIAIQERPELLAEAFEKGAALG